MRQPRQLLVGIAGFVAVVGSVMGSVGDSAAAHTLTASGLPSGCDHIVWSGRDASFKSQIYVSNSDGTGRVEVSTADNTTTDPVFSNTPDWSPDGTKILWKGITSGSHVFVADPDGLNRVDITSVGANPPKLNKSPAWSPDSARVAWAGQDPVSHQNEIWVANADGTSRAAISNVGANPPTGNDSPAWSPDATKIAWRGITGGVFHVFVANPDGSGRVDVIDPAAPQEFNAPIWAPDGSRLAFNRSATTVSGANGLFTVRPDGTDFVAASDVVTTTGYSSIDVPVWSPDSLKIAFAATTDTGDSAVMVMNPDGTSRINIGLVTPPAVPPSAATTPAWSPTGTEIAWSGNDGTTTQIYTTAVDGNSRVAISSVGPSPLPTGSGKAIGWAPDGQQLAWPGDLNGIREVMVAGRDGSGRVAASRSLGGTLPSANDDPHWQPRLSTFSLATSLSAPTLSESATWTATITNTGPCRAGGVEVQSAGAPCLNPTSFVSSSGSFAGTTWHVGTLASGASATITVTGKASAPLACVSASTVAAAPVLSSAATSTVSASVAPCPVGDDSFTDVPADSFARSDITCLNLLGITNGTSPTTYSPLSPVDREQMASFLARTWRTLGETCSAVSDPFVDVSASSFARADITCIYNAGITTGTSPVTYSPSDQVTREQMASFLARLWRLRGGSCSSAADPFVDVSASSFARTDITCIYNLGITTGTSNNTYSPSNPVTREQMAAFLNRLVGQT